MNISISKPQVWLLVLFFLCACARHVVEETGGAGGNFEVGGGGIGGEGGSPIIEQRSLSVRVERRFVAPDSTFASYPLQGLLVFSNAVDGSVLSTATTGADGVAELEVVNNGFVSAVAPDESGLTTLVDEIVSIRVVEGKDLLRLPLEARGYVPQEREPMALKVEWDLVQDAIYRVYLSCDSTGFLPEGTSFVDLLDFRGCPGSDEVAVVVEALLAEGDLYEPMLFGYVRDLTYVPGGEVSVYVALDTGRQETTWLVEGAEDWNDAYDIAQARLLPGTAVGVCDCGKQELVDGGLLATAVTAAFPELPVWSHAFLAAECSNTEFQEIAPNLAPLSVAVTRLAGAVLWPEEESAKSGTAGWKLLDGEVGDVVEFTMAWQDHNGDVVWRIWEPALPYGEIAVPQLPGVLPDDVGLPSPDLAFYVSRHMDVVEATDYAAFLELVDSENFHRQEFTHWSCEVPAP